MLSNLAFVVAFAAAVAYIINIILSLARNHAIARKTGFPIVVSLIDPTNALWILTKPLLLPLLALLPGDAGKNSRLSSFGWQFKAKNTVHERLGKIFIQVTPSCNIINIADHEISYNVMQNIEDFVKPRKSYQPLEVFGPHVDSVNGDDWRRHRKFTTPAFNERISSLVWEEGSRQACQMLADIDSKASGLTSNITDACKTIALHVLTYAGFGIQNDYDAGVTDVRDGYSLAYKDALCTVLANMALTMVFPPWVLSSPLAPRSWRKVGLALLDFRRHMKEMLEKERADSAKFASRPSESLTSAFIRAAEDERKAAADERYSQAGLSDSEIYGNMFIFNVAGHDTTANTMSYAIALMAIHPDVQEWVAQEVRAVLSTTEKSKYDQVFPRLKRVRALMYETLRLYPPVVFLPKITGSRPTAVPRRKHDGSRAGDIVMPPDTYVVLIFMHLHTSPEPWGQDALAFRPGRWISSQSTTVMAPEPRATGDDVSEVLVRPAKGAFTPWAAGPRVCPGMKFAQVEFVSVISSLLLRSRVTAGLPPGTRDKMKMGGAGNFDIDACARNRLQMILDDSDLLVTTTMLRPEDVWLHWRLLR